MPRLFDIRVKEDNEKFLSREPIVLVTTLCLSLLNGITLAVEDTWRVPSKLRTLWSLSDFVVPLPGVIFAAFLSEVVGRKPVYMGLFTLSLSSSVLHAFPNVIACITSAFAVQALVRGGTLVMNAVAICEYSAPKHRFAWMIGHNAMWYTVGRLVPKLVFSPEVVSKSPYIQSFQLVLGLICLGLTWVWPESPYYLASKGKLDDCARSFLWLRGEEGRREVVSVIKACRSRGPAKLFWTSLSIAMATISVTIFSTLLENPSVLFYYTVDQGITAYKTQTAILLISSVFTFAVIVMMSYSNRRRVLFLLISGLSFKITIFIALWIHRDPYINFHVNGVFYFVYFVYDVVRTCGPTTLGMLLFIEIVPQQYNSRVSCICFICYFVCKSLLTALTFYLYDILFYETPAYLAVCAFLSLPGAILYYCYAPATKDRTLLEIQRSYPTERNNDNPEQNQTMMQNL